MRVALGADCNNLATPGLRTSKHPHPYSDLTALEQAGLVARQTSLLLS